MRNFGRQVMQCINIKALFTILILISTTATWAEGLRTGAEQTERYLTAIKGRKICILANQTSMIGDTHLIDSLHSLGVKINAIFAAEHGFRGDLSAGETVRDNIDKKTGIRIVSLYGAKNDALVNSTVQACDIVIVDIQDVGTRFYTYYITMLRLMNKCALYGKRMIVLDRPNPNGHYVDGPILDMRYKSGVGALPIPVVHGMTLGELARMINGEGWLDGNRKCQLTVITCSGYTHHTYYTLPVAPSPNLPDMTAIYLYPSLCYFEGTPISIGRGTDKPFKIYGHPIMKGAYTFTPRNSKSAINPPCMDKLCHGYDLSDTDISTLRQKKIDLSHVIRAYQETGLGDKFFTSFFEKLIGVDYVRKMIQQGKSADEISAVWQDDVAKFRKQRAKYLLYAE